MTTFLQLHYLTVYPPSNPNRDDMGRPKQALIGGAPRLRLSSQSIKRAVRTSPLFQEALAGHIGDRTKRIGEVVRDALDGTGEADVIRRVAIGVADVFAKMDAKANADETKIRTAQLAFISPDERVAAIETARKWMAEGLIPPEAGTKLNKEQLAAQKKEEKALVGTILRSADGAADIAMFGRMLADDPGFNREAAVQVAHAFTTHRAVIEDDFFTAVDDLKNPAEDSGAEHVGEHAFGSGVFYTYTCVNCDLLVKNLAGDLDIAATSAKTLAEALAIATPSGKQNSHAHHPRAAFIRAEMGSMQPRDLSGAFFNPIPPGNGLEASIKALQQTVTGIDRVYGSSFNDALEIDVSSADSATMVDLRDFAEKAVRQVGTDG